MKLKIGFLFVFILFQFVFAGFVFADEKVGLNVGQEAPDFELETLNGEKVKLSDYRGQPVMLNFWATWCPPCKEEIPDMQKFYEENDIVVLAVNLTDTEMSKKNVQKFADEYGITFPVVLDVDSETSLLYKINPIPTSYMIDKEGMITHKQYGAMTYEMMMKKFNKITE